MPDYGSSDEDESEGEVREHMAEASPTVLAGLVVVWGNMNPSHC